MADDISNDMEKAHDVEVEHPDDIHSTPDLLPASAQRAQLLTYLPPEDRSQPDPERTIWQLYPLWQIFALWLLTFVGTWPIFFYSVWTLLEWYHGRPVRFNGDVPFWQGCVVYGVCYAGANGCWSVVKGRMVSRGRG